MSFKERAKMLDTLGVKYNTEYEYRGPVGPERKQHNLELFNNVSLPLTPHELCELFMSEGQFYMGGCCSSMSHLQDIVSGIIRFDAGWFSIEKLSEIAELMIGHGDDEDEGLTFHHLPDVESLDVVVAEYVKELKHDKRESGDRLIDPWMLMALVWHITKDHYGPSVPKAQKKEDLYSAIRIVMSCLSYISWDNIVPTPPSQVDSQNKASRALLLHRMLPAWETLNEKINSLDLGSVEGFALIDKEVGPESICTNHFGYCIYDNQKDIDEIMGLWRKEDSEYKERNLKPIDERIGVRRVRVSAENGIEFL